MPLFTSEPDVVYPISLTKNPALPVGTVAYFQSGKYGEPLGLLLALTNTPTILKSIMTTNGLRNIP